jgi:hypothetical protein
LALVSCATEVTPTTDGGDATSTMESTVAPTTSTTVASTSTTVAATATTTTGSSVLDEAEGSGCSPGPGPLGDGEWYGDVVTTGATSIEFDLACWFTGDAAARAAAEDGEESPPPNDYYVRNDSDTLRTVPIGAGAEVIWFPEFGDPTSEATTTYEDWIVAIEERGFLVASWLTIEGGEVVSIREQWVP